MRKPLVFIPLALASLLATGACTLSFAADVADMEEFASPQSEQPSQRLLQQGGETGGEEQKQVDPADEQAQGSSEQTEEASPSQRSMRQQIKEAKRNSAPVVDNP